MDLSSQERSVFNPLSGLDSLAAFASNTGGRFIKGVTDIGAALTDIADATKAYYVIAFSPTSSDVGKLRKLKIKVKQPGLKVNHRPAYFVPDPKKADPNRQALQASEMIAKGISGGPIRLSAYALPYRSPQNGIGVPIVVQIPAEAFIEPLKRKQINLELFGYLVDDKGTVADFFAATPSLDPVALGARLKSGGLQVLTTFAAAAGKYEVRLLLRDPESQMFGALRIPVVVPNFPAASFVSSPMVTDDPFARVALPTVTARHPSREIPFRIAERPFTVEADPVLKRGAPREICVFKSPSTGEAQDLRVVLIGADGVEKAQTAEGPKVSARRRWLRSDRLHDLHERRGRGAVRAQGERRSDHLPDLVSSRPVGGGPRALRRLGGDPTARIEDAREDATPGRYRIRRERRCSRKPGPRSWRLSARSTVAFRKPSFWPASYLVPSNSYPSSRRRAARALRPLVS